LVLAKPFGAICLIIVGTTFYRLMNKVLCMLFCDAFTSHLSPYQFEVVVKRGCEVVVDGIQATLDAHLDWVVFQVDIVNIFNTILCKVIF
jgi:hypothetical protein